MQGLDLETPVVATPQGTTADAVSPSEAPIMVAVDFTPDSEAALIWACDYADKIGAPLEILHVVHDPADSPGAYRPDNGDALEPMTDVARRKLADFIERVGQENPVLAGLEDAASHCTRGLPAATILDVAVAHGARLLVMGGRRRNGLARFFHGSVSHQVAGNARLPVTIVKAESP